MQQGSVACLVSIRLYGQCGMEQSNKKAFTALRVSVDSCKFDSFCRARDAGLRMGFGSARCTVHGAGNWGLLKCREGEVWS